MERPTRLFDFPLYQLKHFPLDTMMTSKTPAGWNAYSTSSFVEAMHQVSKGLISLGVKAGDKVALITTSNRCEWNICDMAILQIGAIDVPIYPTMTDEDFVYILNHSESVACIVSGEDLWKRVSSIQSKTDKVKHLFTFDPVPGARHWTELIAAGNDMWQQELEMRSKAVQEMDLATIIYTSGTTGVPKGVMLSHHNLVTNVQDCTERLPYLEVGKSRCVSFLPISHVYERMLHYLYMNNGVSMFLTGLDSVKDDLNYAEPYIFTAVPRLLEKFYDGVMAKGLSNKGIKKKLFQWAHNLAIRWEPESRNGWFYELQLSIARKLVFSKVKMALGLSEIKAIASGSAALQPRLAKFFNGAGIPLLEGYGLTETSPVVSVNAFRKKGMYKNGSVGKPIPNVEVAIADDGEILIKGPNVMLGYYKQPELTQEAIVNGWFHTGDIGELQDGFLVITDRKKEMFKTSGGKYVSPQRLENKIKESPYIEQCAILGENEKYPAALIVPMWDRVKAWCVKKNIDANSKEMDLIHHADVIALIRSEIEKSNANFGKWEQVKAFRLIAHPFSIEGGELTPTMKLKRKAIMTKYHDLIHDIYKHDDNA